MFGRQRFVQDCIEAVPDCQKAVRKVVLAAVSASHQVMRGLGEPEHAGIITLYRSPELTIINFAWAPCMSWMPHNHQMYSVVGIYSGREDNVFLRRTPSSIEAAGAKSFGVGDVASLGQDVIHSVLNPIAKMTCAIHVYDGDIFFNPPIPRSEWDHESLVERSWDIERVRTLFLDAEERFTSYSKR